MADISKLKVNNTSYNIKDTTARNALSGKQNTLTFDTRPTANSTNPVTSGGVYSYLSSYYRQVYRNVELTLTNTAQYPFNNSKTTVSLDTAVSSNGYDVHAEVISSNGDVGQIIISDKLTNGFKAQYTGSASSAVIRFVVMSQGMR